MTEFFSELLGGLWIFKGSVFTSFSGIWSDRKWQLIRNPIACRNGFGYAAELHEEMPLNSEIRFLLEEKQNQLAVCSKTSATDAWYFGCSSHREQIQVQHRFCVCWSYWRLRIGSPIPQA